MLSAFLYGAAAGYAIAIPVGPIAVLIVRTGLRRGFRVAAAAGAGAATVDLIYAMAAVFVGAAIVTTLGPVLVPFRRRPRCPTRDRAGRGLARRVRARRGARVAVVANASRRRRGRAARAAHAAHRAGDDAAEQRDPRWLRVEDRI